MKTLKSSFTIEEIKVLISGGIIRKDNSFCMSEYTINGELQEDGDIFLYLMESHCGYGKADFWTEWEKCSYFPIEF